MFALLWTLIPTGSLLFGEVTAPDKKGPSQLGVNHTVALVHTHKVSHLKGTFDFEMGSNAFFCWEVSHLVCIKETAVWDELLLPLHNNVWKFWWYVAHHCLPSGGYLFKEKLSTFLYYNKRPWDFPTTSENDHSHSPCSWFHFQYCSITHQITVTTNITFQTW